MHINAKRLKRRINKECRIEENADPQDSGVIFYSSPGLITDPDTIIDTAEMPPYMSVNDYKDRAAMLGIKIKEEADEKAGGVIYTISGGRMIDLEEPPATYSSPEDMTTAINDLWETLTEPMAVYYTDNAGRLHERLIYPDL